MAKILGTVVGLDHFDRHYEGGQLHPVVPSDIETVHLCELGPEPWNWGWQEFITNTKEPMFLETRFDTVSAACGRKARVLLPQPFDSESSKACSRCLEAVGLKG